MWPRSYSEAIAELKLFEEGHQVCNFRPPFLCNLRPPLTTEVGGTLWPTEVGGTLGRAEPANRSSRETREIKRIGTFTIAQRIVPMAYHRFQPHAALRPWVECLWVQESLALGPAASPTTVLPAGRPELLVHFHEPFEHLEGGDSRQMPMTFALGQRTRPIAVRASGRTGIVIVGFRPWAAEVLLQGCAVEGVDAAVDLEDLNRAPDARMLATRVDEAPSARERAAFVEAFLLKALMNHEPDPMVVAAVERLNRSWGSLSIRELAADLAVSRRNLQRRFTRKVGLGPKHFARLIRFQKAIGLLRSGYDWQETVGHCGYVDQPHLIRECKAFSGHTPAVLQQRPSTPLMRFYNPSTLADVYSTVYC